MNELSKPFANVDPFDQCLGKVRDPGDDVWNRREVKQLEDISFEEDPEPEDILDAARMPGQIITEEKL